MSTRKGGTVRGAPKHQNKYELPNLYSFVFFAVVSRWWNVYQKFDLGKKVKSNNSRKFDE